MITHTPEYRLVQNPALGSLCLWAFARRYWEDKKREAGAPMVLAPCVLPVTFHRETVDLLYRRHFDGGLLNALADDRAFPAALQQRMENMLDQTFEALNVGFAVGLFTLDHSNQTLIPGRLTRPVFQDDRLCRQMLDTAERLAHWFVIYPLGQICSYLRIQL